LLPVDVVSLKQCAIVYLEKGSTCGHQLGLSHGPVELIGCLRCQLSTEDDALIDCQQQQRRFQLVPSSRRPLRAERLRGVVDQYVVVWTQHNSPRSGSYRHT